MVSRTTRVAAVDAAEIIAISDDPEPAILLVEQYRPPIGNVCIEFPAGL
jgi:8-oxo-dGTP pyrophosphatase MutT (NUDIX family)